MFSSCLLCLRADGITTPGSEACPGWFRAPDTDAIYRVAARSEQQAVLRGHPELPGPREQRRDRSQE